MKKKLKLMSAFLGLVVVAVLLAWLLSLGHESTDDATIEAHAIPISAKVSGYIVSLNVRDNQKVKKGDVLVEIDPRDYQLRVDAAKAVLVAAQAGAKNATDNEHRQVTIGKAAGTQKSIDNAIAMEIASHGGVDNAKAKLAIAEKDLADTRVLAPEDGIVTMRTAEHGAFVGPGQNLMVIVGNERWVTANFKEVQITDMRPGQRAELEVDAYPNLKLKGHVDSIQSGTGARFSAFPPENATGNFVKIVQRVPVKILLDDPIPDNVVLGPGLSVVPTVYTGKTKPAP